MGENMYFGRQDVKLYCGATFRLYEKAKQSNKTESILTKTSGVFIEFEVELKAWQILLLSLSHKYIQNIAISIHISET